MDDKVNYVNIEKDSQFFNSLLMIHDCLLSDESKEYIRIGILNTINNGYSLLSSADRIYLSECNKNIRVVPYQLCPKCFGTGKVMNNECWGNTTSISTGPVTCDVCNGVKIIPQAVI